MAHLRTSSLAAAVVLLVGCASSLQDRVNTASSPCAALTNVLHVPVSVSAVSGLVVGGYTSGRPDKSWLTGQEKPLSGARVFLRELGGTMLVQDSVTDGDGRFALNSPPVGQYQLEVCYPGFVPAFMPLRLTEDAEPTPLTIGLELPQ